MSNVIDFPRKTKSEPAGEPVVQPLQCLLAPSIRVLDFTRVLEAGGFTMIYNKATDCVLIKAAKP